MNVNGRDLEILEWLVHMKFMLLDQIRDAFFKGCNPHRSPYRRILGLMKEGLIAKKKVYIEPKDVYVPTRKAISLLRSKRMPYISGFYKDSTFPGYGHDKMLIDLRILFKDMGIETWVPERVIRSIKSRGACPDALIITNHCHYAIEYEHTEKRLERYREILKRYRDREKYSKVIYVMPSVSLIDRIMRKCDLSDNIFFCIIDHLLRLKEETVFESAHGAFQLLKEMVANRTEATLHDFTSPFLEEIVKPLPDESWKNRKPFIPGGGGSHRRKKKEQDNFSESEEEDSDGSYYPKIYPSIYPTDPGGHDSWEEDGI